MKEKELSVEEREGLLKVLKERFEKNMNRHKDIEWSRVQEKLEANTEKLWSLNEMERTGGELDVVGHEKRRANIFFMTVQRKVLKTVEMFVMTVKRWSQGKNINPKIPQLTWQLPWALKF